MTNRTNTRRVLLARTALGSALFIMATSIGSQASAQVASGAGGTVNAGTINGQFTSSGSGGATISNPTGTTSEITLGSSRTLLGWDSFNLASGNTLNFIFGGRGDIVLNRVDAGAATINGALNANIGSSAGAAGGSVWFTAPGGVTFGSNAVVNVGGLLATSGAITGSDFFDGNASYTFSNGPVTADVLVNAGAQLRVHGGTLALVAPTVQTAAGSTITDQSAGKDSDVLFGAADQFTITFAPDADGDLDLLSWTVPASSLGTASVQPIALAGTTTAGNIYVAAVSRAATTAVIPIEGILTANGAVASGDGDIILSAGGGISGGVPTALSGQETQISIRADMSATRHLNVQATDQISATGGSDISAVNDVRIVGETIGLAGVFGGQDVTLLSEGALLVNAMTVGDDYSIRGAGLGLNLLNLNLGAGRDITVEQLSGPLSIGGAVSGANVAITTPGALTLGSSVTGTGNVSLSSGGLLQVAGAIGVGGNYFVRADDFGSGTLSPNFGAGTTNGFTIESIGTISTGARSAPGSLSIKAEGGDIIVSGALSTPNGNLILRTTDGGNIDINAAISATAGFATVQLLSSGTVNQNAAGVVTTPWVEGSAAGVFNLGVANNVLGYVGAVTANGITVKDLNNGLQLGGNIAGGNGGVNISTSGLFHISGRTVSATGGTISLTGTSMLFDQATITNSAGNVALTGPLALSSTNSVTAGGADSTATFNSTVGGDPAVALDSLTVTGGAVFNASVGVSQGLNALTVNGSTAINGGAVQTAGAQNYNGAVTLGANTTLTSTASGAINLGGTVDGARTLAVNTAGATTFGGDIGGTTALTSLATNTGGTTAINGNVTTTGSQTYGDAVTLSNGLHTISAGSVSFASSVNAATFGNPTLSIGTTGATSFANTIFGLAGLGVTASTVSFAGLNNRIGTLAADIGTGGLSFGTEDSLTIGTVNGLSGITTASGQNISIETPTSNSTRTLTVAAPITASGGGDVSVIYWGGSVQGSSLISGDHLLLLTNEGIGTSTTRVQTAANSMTAWGGNQGVFINEANAVTLQNTVIPACSGTCTSTINNGGASYDLTTGGTITAAGFTWTGSGGISLAANSGNISITMPSTDRIDAGGGDLRLTAAGYIENVNGAPLVGRDIYLSAQNFLGSSIFSNSVLQETRNLSITDTFGGFDTGTMGAANNLSITANNGGLNVNGALNAGGSISLAATGAGNTLALAASLDATGDPVNLTSGGAITQSAGTITSSSISATAATGISLAQANAVGTFTSLQNSGAGNISVRSNLAGGVVVGDVDAANGNITLSSTTGIRFVGGTSDVDAASGNVSVDGPATVTGAVAIDAAGTGKGNVTFGGLLNGASAGAGALTINANGATTFSGAVGGTALASLTTDAAGSTTLNGNVTTTGAQTFNDAVNLGAAATLSSSGGNAITLGGTVNGAQALTVNTAGATTFGGNVGATTALTSLATNAGGTTTINGNVTTSGNQSYGDATTLAGNIASTAGNVAVGDLGLTGTGTRSVSGAALTFNSVSAAGGAAGFQAAATGNLTISTTTHAAEVALSAGGAISTGSISSRDDIALRAVGSITTGALFSGINVNGSDAVDVAGAADTLAGAILSGNDVDALAGTNLAPATLRTAAVRANGAGSDARLSGLSVGHGAEDMDVAAGGNIVIGGVGRGRDIALNAGGTITAASLSARDDIALRATGAISTGNLVAGSAVDTLAALDVAGAADGLTGTALAGNDVDAVGLGIVTPGATAASDVRLNAGLGAIGSGSQDLEVNASGNVVLVASGGVMGRDIVLSSGAGSVTAGQIQARDDVFIRAGATGAVTVGAVTTGATINSLAAVDAAGIADTYAGATLAGNDVDVLGNGIVTGTILATESSSDVRLDGGAGGVGQSARDLAITAANDIDLSGIVGRNVSLVAGNSLNLGGGQIHGDYTAQAKDFAGASLAPEFVAGSGDVVITDIAGGLTMSQHLDAVGSVTVNVLNDGALTLGGPQVITSANEGVSLNAHGIILAGNITTGATQGVSLVSTAGISQASGAIVTGTLSGSAANNVSLGDTLSDNNIASLGSFTSGGRIDYRDVNGFAITGPVTAASGMSFGADSGNVTLAGNLSAPGQNINMVASLGSITQTAGVISAGSLTGFVSTSASLTQANQITNLGAFTANSLDLVDVGGIAITGGVQTNVAAGDLTIRTTGGALTIASGGSLLGRNVALSTDGAFINNAVGNPISTNGAGHWLVYAAAPGGNTYGTLNSNNNALWNATIGTAAPASISGNRYVFAYQPTVTFTTLDRSKVYGTDLSGSIGTLYTVSGLQSGVTGAYLADTAASAFSGAPIITSGGLAERATVAGGPYAVNIAAETLAGRNGYAVAVAAGGTVTVTPKAITGTATAASKTYDGSTAATGGIALSGVVTGDTVEASGNFAFADKNAGTGKAVTVSGIGLSGADAGNYTLTVTGSMLADILQKVLTATVTVADKTYDGTAAASGAIALTGVVTGDAVSSGASFAFHDANAGPAKVVTVSNAALTGVDAANYSVTLPASAVAAILRRAITVSANPASKTAGQADPALAHQITSGSLVSGESLSGALSRVAGEAAGNYAIQQGTLAASANYQLTFVGNTLIIQPTSAPVEPLPPPATPPVTPREDWDGFLNYIAAITPPTAEAPPILVLDEGETCSTGSGGASGECVASPTSQP